MQDRENLDQQLAFCALALFYVAFFAQHLNQSFDGTVMTYSTL